MQTSNSLRKYRDVMYDRAMRITLKQHGIKSFMNANYGDKGGYERLVEMKKRNYPKTVIGKEFGGVGRDQVREWFKYL